MSAVLSSQNCLKHLIKSKKLFKIKPKKQDRGLQMSYTRNKEFNDKSINKFWKIKKIDIQNSFKNDHLKKLLFNPYYFNKKGLIRVFQIY